MDKYFTAYTYIARKDKVLLHLHKRHKIILPVGDILKIM